ncbi:hypothetical protein JHN63_02015 [Streptomyces sp. MBT65]|uniref:hypothetical protein n=1 Tax=Streptomyces sp. MBT65 TaxID=1488395 RepID=UPI00190DB33C|nr:hypothetical protein [Streptomyces sp. MBT65]MBK3572617.1 hypothetical protein [Streptomyces sp. MBT65]
MFLDQPIAWTSGHQSAVLIAGVLVALLVTLAAYIAHRTSGTVLAASIGALVCTGFSADTSWRFADHRLHMEVRERLWLFAAGEIVLVVCAVMARANKIATSRATEAGTPGVPGVMVWCIAGVQVIPAFTESGLVGGLVRAVFGPVMAALLWHLAMGLEIRVARPQALSSGLPAQIGHELRERLLSYLGLATRGRTAAQVSRDRATARAVRLASRRRLGWWGRGALKASVARSGAAVDAAQRHQLMQLLAARRSAGQLRDVELPTPWTAVPVPEPYPSTPLGVAGAELRRLDPVDAVVQVHGAHPDTSPAQLASLCTEYGVPVSEAQVRIALHAVPEPVPDRVSAAVPTGPAPVALFPALPVDPVSQSIAHEALPDTVEYAYQAGGLQLDLRTEAGVRPSHACAVPARARTRSEVHARVPEVPSPSAPSGDTRTYSGDRGAEDHAADREPSRTRPRRVLGIPQPAVPGDTATAGAARTPSVPESLIERARQVDLDHRRTHGRTAPIRVLKAELGIGQDRAVQVRDALADQSARQTP